MRVLVALSGIVHLAIASTCRLGQANDDCKKCTLPRLLAERDCPPYGYDCHESYEVALNFSLSNSPNSGCARLSCADPLARLFVDRSDKKLLRCRSHHWHYGKRDCERTAHAICARPCTACKTAVPDCVRNDFQKASITAVSSMHPCPVASCGGGPEIALFGIRGLEGLDLVVDRIDEGHLTCGGGGVWKSAGSGEIYDHALCGDATYSCQTCEDITLTQATVLIPGAEPIGPATPGTTGCKSIMCDPGSTLVVEIENNFFETNSVVCGPRGKWLIDGVQQTNVQGHVCVQKCDTCSIGLDGKGLVAPESPFVFSEGTSCSYATCSKSRLYYLKTRNDTNYMLASIPHLMCDPSTQMWMDKESGELYYQLACQMDACLSCSTPVLPAEKSFDLPPGYLFAGQAYEVTEKCKSIQCSSDSLLMYRTNDNMKIARSVTCGGFGLWLTDGAIINMQFACAKSCRECVVASQSGIYASPTLFSARSSGCLRATCLDGVLYAKNGSKYLHQANPEDPSNPIFASCETDGTWSIGSERRFDSIACSKINAICSTGCSQQDLGVLTTAPYGYVVTQQNLKYRTGLTSGLCATISCELPYKLAIERHAATGIALLSSTLTCRGDNMWYRDQFERLKATKAGCVAPCDKCSVEFPTLDRNFTKATFRTTTNGCLAPLACPEGNFVYMTSSDSQPEEAHDEPRCESGKWSIGEQSVSFVGCKGSCPSLNELVCDRGEPCALDLIHLNDDNPVLVCVKESTLIKSTSPKREAGERGQYIKCSSEGRWWSPPPAKVEYNFFTCIYACSYECETSTDGGLLSIPANVQIVRRQHLLRATETSFCIHATCAPDQTMFGINEDNVPHAIGKEATCIDTDEQDHKWLAKTGGKYLKVFCVDK